MAAKKKAEKMKEELRKLTLLEDNKNCFICGMRGPLYVVLDFHIFVCTNCSAIHRSSQHKVKGISMSEFNQDELDGMKAGGNKVAKKVWLTGFRGSLPRDSDERGVRDHIRHIFEEKRYYSKEEDDAAKAAATLPPVQAMPSHIVPHLTPTATAAVPHHQPASTPAPAPAPAPAPVQQSAAQAQPVVQALPVQQQPPVQAQPEAPQPQAMPQPKVDVFDTMFQPQPVAPAPSAPHQSQPQQPSPATAAMDDMDFFNERSNGAGNGQPQPQASAPVTHQGTHAAQMQMHTTQYQPQMGGTHAAQAQMDLAMGSVSSMNSNPGYQQPQYQQQQSQQQVYQQQQQPQQTQDFFGAPQAAQHQMTGGQQGGTQYSAGTQHAAQHQMNMAGNYGAPAAPYQQQYQQPMQPPQQGNQFATHQPPQQQQPMDFFQASSPQGASKPPPPAGGAAFDPFSGGGGGPPPIPANGQAQAHGAYGSPYQGGAAQQAPPAAQSPKGPDPFASLDFFKK